MAQIGGGRRHMRAAVVIGLACILASALVSADRRLMQHEQEAGAPTKHRKESALERLIKFLWQPKVTAYVHVWPDMSFGWRIILGSIIGFFGAAFGSVGGVGGGGIFVPMLTLIIGFDAKSSTAISKCMIVGAAGSTVYYNLRLRHPTLPLPIIDYDLALLFQPMLMLGISIGVAFNVVFADWMVTVLLIVIFMITSTKAFLRGVETWKKESKTKKTVKAAKENGSEEMESGARMKTDSKAFGDKAVSVLDNIYWKELTILIVLWVVFLAFQIAKNYTRTCSPLYWVFNLLQFPAAIGVSLYEAVSLYKGRRTIASKGGEPTNWKIQKLVLHCFVGMIAGVVGGLLGLGGGFILGPLFLELGIPPQVASATATFAMSFSSSMSVVEYYLLKRFPVPYALYFFAVATVAALAGQHVARKVINFLGRVSLIIFILASTIFVSAISLGGVGLSHMVHKIETHTYMGFENLCSY
ncbi:hypothetical protein EJ110_NYTH31797 [Nymphaea thermarum]|nr:hypothetical protein EJ110_NYTH31797 [Nymphaea thermarum]